MKEINGGVCAPKGFSANGIHCGIRKNKQKPDLALIVSDKICNAGCVYTRNLVKGAPLVVTKENLSDGKAQAIICNSGNANTCNSNGIEIAEGMCRLVSEKISLSPRDVIVASTGVIGEKLDLAPIAGGMDELVGGLGDKSSEANRAIMTTDTVEKTVAFSFSVDGKECRIGGIAKGSGMIHPNMATMLVFITTDVAISSEMLQKAVEEDVKNSFNMVSVDGDTSTNDMLAVLANREAGNKPIECDGAAYRAFRRALAAVTVSLCRKIAKDGEGATKLLECKVFGAKSSKVAKTVAKSVITSTLFKAAMFGSDANWGRILCAIGYSGADVNVNLIDVDLKSELGVLEVCRQGSGIGFDEEHAKRVLSCDEIQIIITLNSGRYNATAWGCDLTYDYVKINGDYRT